MSPYLIVTLFIFGAAVGSFLNVLILRFDPEESVFSIKRLSGRSKCPECKKKLEWYELVPLFSFLVQGGKCRGCGKRLSIQYPLVEFLSGSIVAGVPWFLYNFYNISRGSVTLDTGYFAGIAALWVLIFLVWLVIAFIDEKHYIIPDELNVLLGVLGFFIIVSKTRIAEEILPFANSFLEHFATLSSPFESILANHLLGAFVGAFFFAGLIIISGGRAMGWGDVKFALAGGLVLGWPDIGLALALSFVIGGVVGAYTLWSNKKKIGDRLPFAPFLIIGMILTVFWGTEIVQSYMSVIGV